MLYIFPCSVSLPRQFVPLLFTFFCFQFTIQIFIRTSLCHCNCLLYIIVFFFVNFSSFLSLILSHVFTASFFLLCFPVLPHSTTMSPYLIFGFQMSLSAQSQPFFSISAVLFQSSNNQSLPPKILVKTHV